MTSEDVEISGYHIPAKVGSFFFLPILYLAMGITLQTQVVHLTYTVCRDPKYVEDPVTSNQNAGNPLPMKRWMHFSHCHLDLVHAVAMVMFK